MLSLLCGKQKMLFARSVILAFSRKLFPCICPDSAKSAKSVKSANCSLFKTPIFRNTDFSNYFPAP